MGFFDQINTILSNELAEYIADRFGLDACDVSNVIKDYLQQDPLPMKRTNNLIKNDNTPVVTSDDIIIKQQTSDVNTCQFKITRGSKGGTVCGTVIRGNCNFCSKHKNRKNVSDET